MIRTGSQYRDSIRDGRRVWMNGERVNDVTTHPMFKPLVDIRARMYDLQHEAALRDALTYDEGDGERHPIAHKLPLTRQDWWDKRRATDLLLEDMGGVVMRVGDEAWARCGRCSTARTCSTSWTRAFPPTSAPTSAAWCVATCSTYRPTPTPRATARACRRTRTPTCCCTWSRRPMQASSCAAPSTRPLPPMPTRPSPSRGWRTGATRRSPNTP